MFLFCYTIFPLSVSQEFVDDLIDEKLFSLKRQSAHFILQKDHVYSVCKVLEVHYFYTLHNLYID